MVGVNLQTVCIFKLTREAKPPRIPRMDHTEYLKEIGRRGGRVKSKAKAEAARRNGLLGGKKKVQNKLRKALTA